MLAGVLPAALGHGARSHSSASRRSLSIEEEDPQLAGALKAWLLGAGAAPLPLQHVVVASLAIARAARAAGCPAWGRPALRQALAALAAAGQQRERPVSKRAASKARRLARVEGRPLTRPKVPKARAKPALLLQLAEEVAAAGLGHAPHARPLRAWLRHHVMRRQLWPHAAREALALLPLLGRREAARGQHRKRRQLRKE
jgi:hypothetical protein